MTLKTRNIIIYTIFGVIVAAAIYWFFFYKAAITINPTPSNAKIEIDNNTYLAGKRIRLSPGLHTLKISTSGYITYEKEQRFKISQIIKLNQTLRKMPEPNKFHDFKVEFPVLGQDKKSISYLSNNGRVIYQVSTDFEPGQNAKYIALTAEKFDAPEKIYWSPNQLFLIFQKSGKTFFFDFKRYDFTSQEIKDWGEDIGDVTWSPASDKVIYYYAPPSGEHSIIRSNTDHTEIERLYDLKKDAIENPKLIWSPDGQKVLVIQNQLYVLDILTRTLTKLIGTETALNASWSPDSSKILYETVAGLSVIGADGKNNQNLNLRSGINKTIWLPDSSGFFAAVKSASPLDDLFKITLADNKKGQFVYDAPISVDMTNLMLSGDLKKMYFTSGERLFSLLLETKEY